MTEDSCCSDSSCGCRIDVFPTSKECPGCGTNTATRGRPVPPCASRMASPCLSMVVAAEPSTTVQLLGNLDADSDAMETVLESDPEAQRPRARSAVVHVVDPLEILRRLSRLAQGIVARAGNGPLQSWLSAEDVATGRHARAYALFGATRGAYARGR